MKSFITLALAAAVSAQQMLVSDTVEKNPFGALVQTQTYEDLILKTIVAPTEPYHVDYSQQTDAINKLTDLIKAKKVSNAVDEPIYTCSNRNPGADGSSFGMFLPVYVSDLTATNMTYTYTASKCFEQIDFQFEQVSQTQFNVHVTTSGRRSTFCKEAFLFANTEIQHPEIFMFNGKHTLQFQTPTAEAQADVGFGGIKVLEFCDGLIEGLESVVISASAFLGGLTVDPTKPVIGSHVPPYMEKANVAFLHEAMGYELVPRTTRKVEIDPDLIQDGDFMAIMRLDGLDPIIMYGSGSHVGHSTMALRFDGELYIVESQAAWYWPTHNLQRTKWADWIQYAENASFHIAWLPMREDVRANFNVKAAQDFFFETEGLPYGFHNFLYGWIDTPRNNLPGMLANEMLPIIFSVVEAIMPTVGFNFFAEALNFRLGTNGLNIAGVAAEAARQGMSIQDVMAMPEIDGWEYTGIEPRDGKNWVCSAYVAALYKAGGLFGELDINATEFTPRDVYMLDFFDTKIVRPQACIDADSELPYCQLLGNYRMTLPGYSTITPYANMNERCASVWPDYIREDGC